MKDNSEMKKIGLIIIMMVALAGNAFAGLLDQKPAETFGIDIFCQPLSQIPDGCSADQLSISQNLWQHLQTVKSDKDIDQALLAAGFKCLSKKQVRELDDSIDEYIDYMKASYELSTPEGPIKVKMDYFEGIVIDFPTVPAKRKFLSTVEANEKEKGYVYESEEAHWVGVAVVENGKIVEIWRKGD